MRTRLGFGWWSLAVLLVVVPTHGFLPTIPLQSSTVRCNRGTRVNRHPGALGDLQIRAGGLSRLMMRTGEGSEGIERGDGATEGGGSKGNLGRRGLLALGVGAISFAAAPRAADAAFGPAGASVRTAPILDQLSLEQFLDLSPILRRKREKTFIGVRGRLQIRQLLKGLDDLPPPQNEEDFEGRLEAIRILMSQTEEADQAPLLIEAGKIQEDYELYLKEKEQRKVDEELEEVLIARQQLLDNLDAQPPIVSYGAAFAASAISTLCMHPVDTLKVRLQSTSQQDVIDDVWNEGMIDEGPPLAP
eukprot:CAMPEP_0172069814 /NCGR_PEP_ID=MMETSP1043-20130122/12937_1 /TAXON_ID=464988 /ORGANISM="Hemiselmis andersenii, Strain CCMP441" /LENGTH=302 /DNA_ID=CAMNT_0012730149 /DNA_START=78 /DNA_END=982 /DNA_ORIENTATION=+